MFGILNDILMSLFFIEGNLNAEIYEDVLRSQVVSVIKAIVG